MIRCSSTPCPAPRLVGLFAVAVLTATPLAAAQRWCPSDVQEGFALSTRAEDDALVVTVDWPAGGLPEAALLSLTDGPGNLVSSLWVTPEPGEIRHYPLPASLASPAAAEFRYTLDLADPSGQLLAPRHPLRLYLSCPDESGAGCVFETVDGVDSDSPVVDTQALDVLDALAGLGTTDLFGDALNSEPELGGQLYPLADQVGRLHQEGSLGGDCFCLWVGAVETLPRRRADLDELLEDREAAGWAGPGADFAFALQLEAPPTASFPQSTGGESRITLGLQCWRVVESRKATLTMAGTVPDLEVDVPVVEPCAASCQPTIDVHAQVQGFQEAQGLGLGWSWLEVAADISTLDEDTGAYDALLAETWEGCFQADHLRSQCSDLRTQAFQRGGQSTLQTSRASLTLRASVQGGVGVGTAQPGVEPPHWGMVCARAGAKLAAQGTAACAVRPEASILLLQASSLQTDTRGGDLIIRPWRPDGIYPPPPGT